MHRRMKREMRVSLGNARADTLIQMLYKLPDVLAQEHAIAVSRLNQEHQKRVTTLTFQDQRDNVKSYRQKEIHSRHQTALKYASEDLRVERGEDIVRYFVRSKSDPSRWHTVSRDRERYRK